MGLLGSESGSRRPQGQGLDLTDGAGVVMRREGSRTPCLPRESRQPASRTLLTGNLTRRHLRPGLQPPEPREARSCCPWPRTGQAEQARKPPVTMHQDPCSPGDRGPARLGLCLSTPLQSDSPTGGCVRALWDPAAWQPASWGPVLHGGRVSHCTDTPKGGGPTMCAFARATSRAYSP